MLLVKLARCDLGLETQALSSQQARSVAATLKPRLIDAPKGLQRRYVRGLAATVSPSAPTSSGALTEQSIDFVRLDWRGQITNVGGQLGYAGNPKLNQAQRSIKATKVEIEIAKHLIADKIDASIKTLRQVIPKSDNRETAISRLNRQHLATQRPLKALNISKLLGIEGASAAAYFSAWHSLPIKWSGIKRKPVPENWFEIVPRTMTWRRSPRNARHPVNAMLNYGYGILANNLRRQIIVAGLDPTVGIIHHSAEIHTPLVCDLMEPLRPVVDRVVLSFALAHTFTPGDFTINKLGGCRLHPQMAKALSNELANVTYHNFAKAFAQQLL
jgi:CRISPR-associated protein Cas1